MPPSGGARGSGQLCVQHRNAIFNRGFLSRLDIQKYNLPEGFLSIVADARQLYFTEKCHLRNGFFGLKSKGQEGGERFCEILLSQLGRKMPF